MWYKNGKVFNSLHSIRLDNPNSSLQADLNNVYLASLGYQKVIETVQPAITAFQIVEPNGVEVLQDGTVQTVWAILSKPIPSVVTMRQARLALMQSALLTTVTNAIVNGTDEAMKIEWEYATDVRRDWPSLIALSTSLGLTSAQLDDLFLLASTL